MRSRTITHYAQVGGPSYSPPYESAAEREREQRRQDAVEKIRAALWLRNPAVAAEVVEHMTAHEVAHLLGSILAERVSDASQCLERAIDAAATDRHLYL